jgi:hypothetical protein
MAVSRVKTSSILQGFPKSRSLLAGNAAFIPTSFESIAIATGTGSSPTITFSSIPQNYKHLQLRVLVRSTEAGAGKSNLIIKLNNDSTTANYRTHELNGNGVSISATSTTGSSGLRFNDTLSRGGQPANVMAIQIIDIQNYKSATNRTVRMFSGMDANDSSGILGLYSGLYLSTTAITQIDYTCPDGNLSTTSKFALYGIKGS